MGTVFGIKIDSQSAIERQKGTVPWKLCFRHVSQQEKNGNREEKGEKRGGGGEGFNQRQKDLEKCWKTGKYIEIKMQWLCKC